MSTEPLVYPIPYLDPLTAFKGFDNDPVAVFFDSADHAGGRGRYSYIAANPFAVISAGEQVKINGKAVEGDPFAALQRELKRFSLPTHQDAPPFQTGAAGFLGYELGRHLERLPAPKPDGLIFPEMLVGLYDAIAAFDIVKQKAWIIASDVAQKASPPINRLPSEVRAEAMAARLANASAIDELDMRPISSWRAETSREKYELAAARIIDYIHAGDIFQANLSQRFIAELPASLSPFALYRRLRKLSPAPFCSYLSCGQGLAIASASPERYLALSSGGAVETRPIKGTRPRSIMANKDAELAASLTASGKDRAENLMIVDLLRNDLSRTCELGSVTAPEIAVLESFANVHHLVSVVRGRIQSGLGAVDLLRAAFPGGSVTGAPKIRAMEIISELEPARRGPYCGAIGWLGFNGAMDTSVIIRTLVINNRQVIAQAGSGIVADSDPAAEYAESLVKARALLESLGPLDNST